MKQPRQSTDLREVPSTAVADSDRGAVSVEYVVVLVSVSMGVVAAIAGLGVPLLNLFYYQQAVLLLPLP